MNTTRWSEWVKDALQNKYVAVTLLALVWATFIHDLGIPFVIRESWGLRELRQELEDVESRNALLEEQSATLLTDPAALERFARERYFMRKRNEEVYRVVD
ncbi:MAG: septum formation initiator family protein [Bacteroidetes bacterium]|nr:septum formation initiator family protein [Bacteroidota bacterium]